MRRITSVAVPFAALVVAMTACQPTPAVSVTPSTNLVDGQTVTVTGSGYSANATVGVVECPTGAYSLDDCDSETAHTLSTDDRGRFSTTVVVKSTINDGHDVGIDCTVRRSCVIASVYVHGFQGLATAPLEFKGHS